MKKKITIAILFVLALLPTSAFAMHIIGGFLPPIWCISWDAICVPFIIIGLRSISGKITIDPKLKILLAMAGAFVFVLSALKMPSLNSSSSHPTGTGLGAILFGPFAMSVIGVIVLLFQALLLAHGGLDSLGANTFSMAIVGPFIAYFIYKIVKKLRGADWLAVFLAAALGDISTYVVTSIQLAIPFPMANGGIAFSIVKFLGVFAVTQIPIAISEGILTVVIFDLLKQNSKKELESLGVL